MDGVFKFLYENELVKELDNGKYFSFGIYHTLNGVNGLHVKKLKI